MIWPMNMGRIWVWIWTWSLPWAEHNALLSSDSDHHKGKMGNVVTENPNRSLESPWKYTTFGVEFKFRRVQGGPEISFICQKIWITQVKKIISFFLRIKEKWGLKVSEYKNLNYSHGDSFCAKFTFRTRKGAEIIFVLFFCQ